MSPELEEDELELLEELELDDELLLELELEEELLEDELEDDELELLGGGSVTGLSPPHAANVTVIALAHISFANGTKLDELGLKPIVFSQCF